VKDEIKRISKLVADGKLSPEDAAELIEAFYESEREERREREEAAGAAPGDPEAAAEVDKDPFKSMMESIERMTKEGMDAVNWGEVRKQARDSAKRGFEALRHGFEEVSKGRVNLGWLLAQESREVTLPLSVPEGRTLRIENACGGVKVLGGFDVGAIVARARFNGSSPEDAKAKADAYTVIIEESDHAVVLRQPDVSGLHVDLEVQLAGHPMVEVRSEAGDVQVLDTKSGCRIHSRSGDVKLRGLDGPIEISAQSGDLSVRECTTTSLVIENKSGNITLAGVRGNINARTVSGDVTLSGSAGKVLSVESISGDVRADLEEPVTGNVSIRTVNGNANVGIADGSDCRVSLSTLRGAVRCELELEDAARTDQRVTGRLGEGNGALDVSAVTGDVCVEMRDARVE
jgi:polyhydroxyalkanoate synthesis regulator phasin